MKCPYCSTAETKVIDSRETEDLSTTRRRRECLKCEKRFTTYERIETIFTVIKKDGRREDFSRDKLRDGLQKACQKRDVSAEDIEKEVNDIEAELRDMNQNEIPSKRIGDIVMKKLKKLDKVAYIRFASVYHDFQDLNDFRNIAIDISDSHR